MVVIGKLRYQLQQLLDVYLHNLVINLDRVDLGIELAQLDLRLGLVVVGTLVREGAHVVAMLLAEQEAAAAARAFQQAELLAAFPAPREIGLDGGVLARRGRWGSRVVGHRGRWRCLGARRTSCVGGSSARRRGGRGRRRWRSGGYMRERADTARKA